MSDPGLLERYQKTLFSLSCAVKKSGRDPSAVKLLAVSKLHPVEAMISLYAAGQRIFGENYVQEAIEKQAVFAAQGIDPNACIHLIGHIQSKKASRVAGKFALIHSLDSQKLALGLEKKLETEGTVQPVLIEVNIGDEEQKSGVHARDLERFADYICQECPRLHIEGLMCLPPFFDNGDAARPFFAKLRKLNEELRSHLGLPLPELSMGMSGDYCEAIEEGATIVRIGTAIFGPRPVQ